MKIALIGAAYNMWAPLTPNSNYEKGRMVAGGESSLICLSKYLHQAGHNVSVFIHTDEEKVYDGVRWVPVLANGNLAEETKEEQFDIAISYDIPTVLNDLKAKVKILENQTNNPNMRFMRTDIDAFVFKSNWHRDAVLNCTPLIKDRTKCHVIGNGLDTNIYSNRNDQKKIKYRMIWTSSPDRGLYTALVIFKEVLKRIPRATLKVFYDFSKAFESSKWAMDYRTEQLWRAKQLMEVMPGVEYVGPVDKPTFAEEQAKAELLLFPEETPRPSEGFSVSVLEAMASSCVPLISDCDCLPELWGQACPMLPLPIKIDDWVNACCHLLKSKKDLAKYCKLGHECASKYTWDKIGQQWEALISKLYKELLCDKCGSRLTPDAGDRMGNPQGLHAERAGLEGSSL